jgi:hypothetical protein
MAGGEMGINEKGLAIGNEAVFSRFKRAKNGILGMDILRSALGSATTAKEALDFICRFVETYDQGGNGAYRGSLYYDNSFIIADPSEAYILETAGASLGPGGRGKAGRYFQRLRDREDYKAPGCPDPQGNRAGQREGRLFRRSRSRAQGQQGVVQGARGKRFFLRFTKGELRRKLSLKLLGGFCTELDNSGLQTKRPGTAKPGMER